MWWKKWTHKSPSTKSCAAESTRSNQAEEKDGGGNETLSKTHHMKWWGHKQGWESILQVKQVPCTSTNHKEKQKLKRSSSCAKKNFERSSTGVHGELWGIEREGRPRYHTDLVKGVSLTDLRMTWEIRRSRYWKQNDARKMRSSP